MERSHIGVQFAWYLLVGGICFWVDIGLFLALQWLAVPVLVASMAGFIAATLANYYLSYKLAFTRGRFSRREEILRLFTVSLVGLGLNTLFVWLFITFTPLIPVAAKVAAVPIVLIWNFLGRRFAVFLKDLPDATYAVSRSIVDAMEHRDQDEPKP